MIIHVFNAKMYHLSPVLIKGLLTSFKDTIGKIILLEEGIVDRDKYKIIFDNFVFKDFIFCSSDYKSLTSIFQQYKDLPILFHGGSFERWNAAFKAGCKNVNWICWGGDASIKVERRKTQSIIKRSIGRIFDLWFLRKKKTLYKRFNSIVALIEPDRQTIVKDFNLQADRVRVIPYRFMREIENKDLIDKLSIEGKAKIGEKPLVLIGNSPINYPFYMQMLDLLKKYSGEIEVHCMYQYPHNKDKNYTNLLRLGKKNFGDDFFIDEQFMNREEYLRYMNLTDIYVCSNPDQTGIGAINSFLRLGKKMYLTGKNYEYVLGIGCKVHHIKEISQLEFKKFVEPDSRSIQDSNRSIFEEMLSKAFDKWANYFKQIDTVPNS